MTENLGSSAKPGVEYIQQEIIRRICFLEYPPGSQLKEAELAEEFGVSRTPVRDAISRIKHLQMVESLNGVGTVVVALSEQQICQVYDMRLQLAGLIGCLSSHSVTAEQLQQLERLLEEAIELQQRFDAKCYVELNHRLQMLLADLISNTLLQSYWLQTYYQAASTWYRIGQLAPQQASVALIDELRDLHLAMKQNDLTAVGLLQRIHIGYGYQRIKDFLFNQQVSAN